MVCIDFVNDYVNSDERATRGALCGKKRSVVTTGMKNSFLYPLNSPLNHFIAVLAEQMHPQKACASLQICFHLAPLCRVKDYALFLVLLDYS